VYFDALSGQFLRQFGQADIGDFSDAAQQMLPNRLQLAPAISSLPTRFEGPALIVPGGKPDRRTHPDFEHLRSLTARMTGQDVARDPLAQINR
jgi:hypothetical protein